MDESFQFFLQTFGPPCARRDVDEAHAAEYAGRLPAKLLEYWREQGFSGYADGLFWVVDPAEYAGVLERWLSSTPFKGQDDYHVIARTAFGALFVWGERSGAALQINPPHSLIFPNRAAGKLVREGRADLALQVFFASRTRQTVDFPDDKGKPLFAKALKKLGPLREDEAYGFVPALGMGGKATLAGLQKVEILPHLEILAQITAPRILENPLLR